MTQLINRCINDSITAFKAIEYDEVWGEVDNPLDLELYEKIYSDFPDSN